ncbi:MAG: hypothetical protein HKN11_04345 [Rhizobiales bacterium]|nr:hypothetical protein [Hyphomicrobiales bacterium]
MIKPVVFAAAAAFSLSLAAESASAQSVPGVDWRQQNQAKRIYHGVANGSLSYRETGQLVRGHARIKAQERWYKRDGVVTHRERHKLHRAQNRQSRRIYRKKHN